MYIQCQARPNLEDRGEKKAVVRHLTDWPKVWADHVMPRWPPLGRWRNQFRAMERGPVVALLYGGMPSAQCRSTAACGRNSSTVDRHASKSENKPAKLCSN
jgi:hypothetical protein